MRYLAIILSVYFLALSFAPCEDVSADSQDDLIELSQNVTTDHDHSTADLCSPFCHCHCCHVHTMDTQIAVFSTVQNPLLQLSFAHFDSIGKDIPHSLLQPPRA